MLSQVLKEFPKRLKQEIGKNLVSVVLFGSRARAEWNEYSDIDLLVVCHSLPEDYSERIEMVLDVTADFAVRLGVTVSPLLMTTEEVRGNLEGEMPLFLNMSRGYEVLYDREGWFQNKMESFSQRILRKFHYDKEMEAWIKT